MNRLSKVHKAEILKRILKRESPTETNMGEQTPPGMPGMPGMDRNPPGGATPMAPTVPPMQVENAESYDQNPVLDLGNQLLQNIGLEQSSQPKEKTKLTSIDEIVKNEATASQIWKVMGGYDSVAGRVWQELSDKSKLYNTGRDYFVSCYNKYMQSPDKFRKTNTREALLIKHITEVMEEE